MPMVLVSRESRVGFNNFRIAYFAGEEMTDMPDELEHAGDVEAARERGHQLANERGARYAEYFPWYVKRKG